MRTQQTLSPASDRETPLDDIIATLDEIERRLHDALALAETSGRVCQQALAASLTLRSRLSPGTRDIHVLAHLEQRQWRCAQPDTPVEAGAPGEGPSEPLTAREREVLEMIARGHSNRRIAEALYLSPRTVERHIANIYLKLDVHTKAEATAWALIHGFVGEETASNGLVPASEACCRPENYICRLHTSTDA